jgi:hypothetical protein
MGDGEYTTAQRSTWLSQAFHQLRFRALVGVLHRLRTWLLRETYALPLDVFRVLVGVLCLAYFLRLLWEVRDFSSPDGLLDHTFLAQVLWFTRLSLFQPGCGAPIFYGAFAIGWLGAWGIVLGYRVKLCAAVLFVIAASHYRWNFIVLSVDDSIMHLLLFWLLLLPVGKTLVCRELIQQGRSCLGRWSTVTVPGAGIRCFLGNVCLVYLVAGLWKLESPMWRQGFALYTVLRLPIAYQPDLWGPQHLPWLQACTYMALVIEPLLPWLLTRRPGHPLKWLGLLAQLGFHLGIVATLRVPFANLGLAASAVLFFQAEIMGRVQRASGRTTLLQQAPRFDRAGRLALVFLLVLTLAMMRRLPIIGIVHRPAFALLWLVGVAQDYQLFNWIDTKNYYVTHEVTATTPDGGHVQLAPTTIFPTSMRSVLLQTYLRSVRWMPFPPQYRQMLKQQTLLRLAQRFCRFHPTAESIRVASVIRRIRPDNVALTRGNKQFWMQFRCLQGQAVLCRTFLRPRRGPADSACSDRLTRGGQEQYHAR